MAVCLKTGIFKLIELNLKNANQLRCYARWSHRRPRKVLTAEEYDKLEENYAQRFKIKGERQLQDDEKLIELDANTYLVPEQSPVGTKSLQKWKPKNIDLPETVINMNELDAKSDTIHYKIQQKNSEKKKIAYKTQKDIKSQIATDMLETIIDGNGEFIYTKLKNNDPAVSQLLLTVKSRKEQIKKDLTLLEGKNLIKEALEAQCTLKSLIFSRKHDVEYLKPYLPKSGAKLYKMPYREIQMWSDLTTTPGIMGIFKTRNLENFISKSSLPLTIICDNVREPGNLGAILRTAAGVGAQCVFLTKGCVDLWDTKVLRSACGAHFRLQIHRKMDWSDIRNRLDNTGSTVFIADNKIITESVLPNSFITSNNEEPLSNKKVSNLKDIIVSMPLLPYYGVKFSDMEHLVLIIGGETDGISEESYRFATYFNGVRLNIPLSNDVDSLNTGTALGIILFEIKRQMALSKHEDEVKLSL